MEPMNSGDIPLYGEFTALKRNGLQTWIAIGGVSTSCRDYIASLMTYASRSVAMQTPSYIISWTNY
jgi:hypothetical protein